MAGSLSDPLWLARFQDVSAWVLLAAALVLAPWDGLYDLFGLPSPEPALAWQAGGVALAACAVALWRSRSRRSIAAAAVADVAGAAALGAWLAGGPGLETRGTIVVVVAVVSLLLQAAVDVIVLYLGSRRTPRRR